MSKVGNGEIAARKRLFDQELAKWEENGDPLSAWTSYLSWMEEKGLSRHDCYKRTIQQCLKYFGSLSEYFGEVRLAQIYISAALLCKDPVSIFKHMHTKGIGAKFSPYYKAYSSALVERKERQEAIQILERGIRQEARPLNLLHKALAELKNEGKSVRGGKSGTIMDEKSERNEEFYQQPQVVCCYEKRLVYPPLGGEQSLEQIRATLSQYAPTFPEESGGECDMEMTEAQMGHITLPLTLNPGRGCVLEEKEIDSFEVFQDEDIDSSKLIGDQSKQRRPLTLLPNKPSPEKELELLMAEKTRTVESHSPQSARKRLVSEEEVEQELGQLMLEKDQKMSQTRPPNVPKVTVEDDFGKQLFGEGGTLSSRQSEAMCKSRDQSATQHNQFQSAPLTHKASKQDKENTDNKENVVYSQKQQFDFTPAGGISVPSASSGVKELATRLNFSEAELSLHQKSGLSHSLLHKSEVADSRKADGQRDSSLAMFNTTLDCEKKAKLTEEQLMFENEFANTEYQDGPLPVECSYQPPSLINETDQSYDVFHDSWNVSAKNVSRSAFSRYNGSQLTKKAKALEPLPLPEGKTRKALQALPVPQEPSFEQYSYSRSIHCRQGGGDSLYSCPPSQTADSFSVFEDSCRDQSSFVPYHDSWIEKSTAGQTREQSSHLGRGPSSSVHSEKGVYHAPVGVPLTRGGGGDVNRTIDQSFTQFDIPRPQQNAVYSNNSTPAGQRVANVMRHNLTLDLSVIPTSEPTLADPQAPASHKQATDEPTKPLTDFVPQEANSLNPAPIIKTQDPLLSSLGAAQSEGVEDVKPQIGNLSTISEESENYRSSQSSSRLTVSSGSSRFSSSASSHQPSISNVTGCGLQDDINPFEPHIINMMFNKVGVSDKMVVVNKPFQKLRSGCGLVLGTDEFSSVRLISEGGFGRVYSAKQGETVKAIKVQSPALEWEVAVIELLHSRLISNNLHQAVFSFIQVEKAFRFEGTSVFVMEHYPFGSLLDLVNSQKSPLNVGVPLYLTCEIVTAVAVIHQCNLLHADIKPDNFMIKDLRAFQDVRSSPGRGLCLVDFGRAIDLQVFPADVMFTGSCKTDKFQCPQMRDGKPWKWQVDYFGVASTIYTLLTGSYMDLVKEPGTDLYKPATPLPRKYRGVWTQIVGLLINASDFLPLVELIQPLQTQLIAQPPKRFCVELSNCFNLLLEYRKCGVK